MTRKPTLTILVLLQAALACGAVLAQKDDPSPTRYEKNIQAFEAADRQNPPPKGAVLFVGSSSIVMWKSLEKDFADTPVINRGFGGSHIADLIYYADRIILPYAPRLVVVYAGDNDLAGGKSPEQLLGDYQKLVAKIHERLPETRIAYISIKPSRARAALLPQVKQANALIQDFSHKDKRLAFIDVFSPMLNADGSLREELFLQDGLHLNAEGYALWKSVVEPFVK